MPRPWSFPVALDPGSGEPLTLQISRAVTSDIRRGRLKAGALLPGSRTLAATLGVHRNTVLAAYRELEAEGWIEPGARSTRVAENLPARPARSLAARTTPGFELEPFSPLLCVPLAPKGTLSLGGGFPDGRLVPTDLLARALRRALKAKAAPLDYGDPQGDGRFRAALSLMLGEMRGLASRPEEILATSGSQMGIDLIARALLRPGDAVAVEDPGYPRAWAALRAAGAELEPVKVDAHGLDVDALEAILARRTLRAIYTTPHHQYPSMATLSAPRRMRLLELARRHRIAIIEDDYDFEFHYDGRPVLPLASADTAGVVIYLGTLSKVLAPGLRLGFIAGPEALVQALAARRSIMDYQGNQAFERAVAELMEDGLLQRHVRRMRRVCQERRDVLIEALERRLGSRLSFDRPTGGMSLWAKAEEVPLPRWAARCREQGVAFHWGAAFDFRQRPIPYLRLGFAALDPAELKEAVRRMAAALP
ncbi:MAG TPA: PLP-dependent aminotransferase family protein [Holophagaceae bacterium]|nr:PLP-dependent aminotransferase family protein [Holophagaceae bacterium]